MSTKTDITQMTEIQEDVFWWLYDEAREDKHVLEEYVASFMDGWTTEQVNQCYIDFYFGTEEYDINGEDDN